jgi:hypothetical protein
VAGRRFYIGPLPNKFSQRSRDLTNLGVKPYRQSPESKFPRLPCGAVSRDESRGLVVAVQLALEAKKQNLALVLFFEVIFLAGILPARISWQNAPVSANPNFSFGFYSASFSSTLSVLSSLVLQLELLYSSDFSTIPPALHGVYASLGEVSPAQPAQRS